MANQGNMQLLILWEHELRDAARLVREAMIAMSRFSDKEIPYQDAVEIALNAVLACNVALEGLDDETPLVMVSNRLLQRAAGGREQGRGEDDGEPADGGEGEPAGEASKPIRGKGTWSDLVHDDPANDIVNS